MCNKNINTGLWKVSNDGYVTRRLLCSLRILLPRLALKNAARRRAVHVQSLKGATEVSPSCRQWRHKQIQQPMIFSLSEAWDSQCDTLIDRKSHTLLCECLHSAQVASSICSACWQVMITSCEDNPKRVQWPEPSQTQRHPMEWVIGSTSSQTSSRRWLSQQVATHRQTSGSTLLLDGPSS